MKFTCTFLLACLLALTASAQTPQFTSISLVTPTLVANPAGALKPGAIYKYANAGGAGSNKIDAYIQFVKTSNMHTSTATQDDAVGLYAFDNLSSVNNPGGYDASFQPVVSSSKQNSSGLWTAGSCGAGNVEISHRADQNYLVHFRIWFKKAGTQIDTALNLKAAFIDIDGFGNGTEAEQDAFMPGVSYAVSPGTTLNITQRPDGLMNAEGDPTNVTGLTFTNNTSITQVTYLYRTYVDFAVGMNTHSANAYGSCYSGVAGGRLKSVSFGTQPTGCTQVTPTALSINGTVWDDADGSANNTFNNIRTNSEPGTHGDGLYVYAVDVATNTIIGKSGVAAAGTWSIADVPRDFSIELSLSKTNVPVGTSGAAIAPELNAGWVATSPLDRPSFVPGVKAGAATVINGLDFGIERTPNSISYSGSITSPALNSIKVLNNAAQGFPSLTGTDPEDGNLGTAYTVVIKSLALNGNQLYYGAATPGTLLKAGDTIYNYNPNYLKIKFTGAHSLSASFNFQFLDKAEVGGTIASYTLNWGTALPLTLSSFGVQKAGNDALVSWSVENDHSNTTTYIERSTNGQDWTRIGQESTNSNTPQATYQFTDNHTQPGVNYYRLAMVDLGDLSQQYSAIAKVAFDAKSSLSIYPNPVVSTLNITNPEQHVITSVRIMNHTGNVVYNGDGSKSQIDMSTLPPGNYIIQVISSGTVETFKVFKQ